jgi:hypothetical protein
MAESVNQRNTAIFLQSLDFDVAMEGRELTATKVVEEMPVTYSLGFLDPDLIGHGSVLSGYRLLTSAVPTGVRRRLVVPEQAKKSGTWFSGLQTEAQRKDIGILTFPEFLRSFVDRNRLETNCRKRMKTLQEVTYIEPVVMTREIQNVPVRRFVDQILLGKPAERLIVVHAPGGRGKTMLAEYCTRRLFENINRVADGPLPLEGSARAVRP